MSDTHDDTSAADAKAALTSIWSAQGDPEVALDEECSPTKQCRNMRDMTFDGFGAEGTDIRTAWRERLAREGKLDTSGGTIRDLVLGPDA
jgi:hypothetical protein